MAIHWLVMFADLAKGGKSIFIFWQFVKPLTFHTLFKWLMGAHLPYVPIFVHKFNALKDNALKDSFYTYINK